MEQHRLRLVQWIRQQLIGPAHSNGDADDETIHVRPLWRYPTGVLYPGVPDDLEYKLDIDTFDDEDDSCDLGTDETGQDALPVTRRRYVPPSSVGFSFFARSNKNVCLKITVSGANYKLRAQRDDSGRFVSREYVRKPFVCSVNWREGVLERLPPELSHVLIDVRSRPHRAGQITTVVFANRQTWKASSLDESCVFEAHLECEVIQGEIDVYPRVDPNLLNEEEQEIELRYRDKRIYAVGHGAAVDWIVEPQMPPKFRSQFIPAVDVPRMAADDTKGVPLDALTMQNLADDKDWNHVIGLLGAFIGAYKVWVDEQHKDAVKLTLEERNPATRICEHMRCVMMRMKRGVALLKEDVVAASAFRLANEAMLKQMRQHDRNRGLQKEVREYQWHPFQLAFLLTTIESTIREADDFRQILDLIWFPTGGGKTEAYLGLIAFLIVWRRLNHTSDGGGTVALMRYTLRLLTRQQFERATRLICSLELLRRKNPLLLGTEPITIGIWVGNAASPNRFKEAKEVVKKIEMGDASAVHRLVLNACPWCEAQFTPTHSYHATDHVFEFRCVSHSCEFGVSEAISNPTPLPCNVVDEALYEHPPTLLIATIDKFARLAWEERSVVFFGATTPNRSDNRPPELVIQDELHLVAGPLGSIAGLYEAALETVLTQRGARPKYIASTATTRMAKEQVRSLYGRDVSIFPPPGLSADDTWFARTDNRLPGRLYVGYMAPGLDRQDCLAPLVGTLLAAPYSLFEYHQDSDTLMESWWTSLIYHSSLRDVASSHNAFSTTARDFARQLDLEREEANRESGDGLDGRSDLDSTETNHLGVIGKAENRQNLAQVTSRVSAPENARRFDQLKIEHGNLDCLDAVLTTNMISVGVDVDRLALMVINGQPFMTAEYIQASSRVGRADVPGLVFANYYRNQARSLSFYENFRPYHESFYRFVEPTSVTPFTHQVRTRALHAALVIVIRHGLRSLCDNSSAGAVDFKSPEIRIVTDELKQRIRRADTRSAYATARHLDSLITEWQEKADRCRDEKRGLHYEARDRSVDGLLCHFDDTNANEWKTLDSMRNVEKSGILQYDD